MGAWTSSIPTSNGCSARPAAKRGAPRYAGRPAAAATATGLMPKHLHQMKAFMDEVYAT